MRSVLRIVWLTTRASSSAKRLEAGPLQKARTIGRLARTIIKAIEVADLAGRVEALEAILKRRTVG